MKQDIESAGIGISWGFILWGCYGLVWMKLDVCGRFLMVLRRLFCGGDDVLGAGFCWVSSCWRCWRGFGWNLMCAINSQCTCVYCICFYCTCGYSFYLSLVFWYLLDHQKNTSNTPPYWNYRVSMLYFSTRYTSWHIHIVINITFDIFHRYEYYSISPLL